MPDSSGAAKENWVKKSVIDENECTPDVEPKSTNPHQEDNRGQKMAILGIHVLIPKTPLVIQLYHFKAQWLSWPTTSYIGPPPNQKFWLRPCAQPIAIQDSSHRYINSIMQQGRQGMVAKGYN